MTVVEKQGWHVCSAPAKCKCICVWFSGRVHANNPHSFWEHTLMHSTITHTHMLLWIRSIASRGTIAIATLLLNGMSSSTALRSLYVPSKSAKTHIIIRVCVLCPRPSLPIEDRSKKKNKQIQIQKMRPLRSIITSSLLLKWMIIFIPYVRIFFMS